MNIFQRAILILGIVVMLVMGLHPPWVTTVHSVLDTPWDGPTVVHRYAPMWSPPSGNYEIDGTRLVIQEAVTAGVICILVLLVGGLREERGSLV
jgi:hypothetical protein